MTQLLPVLNYFTPQVVWGLFPRLFGLVYLIAIGSLYTQVLPLAGSAGIHPIKLQLQKIQRDYPIPRRFLYFPTLLWINADDWMLRGLVLVGALSALLVIVGGPFSGWCLLVCWLVYLSFDLAIGFAYPWDSVLLEGGFLAIFLPPISVLPTLTTAILPLPAVAFAFRFLVFRVLFGFGKFKFTGTNHKERTYLKSFMINQPMPTPLGWWASKLPGWIATGGLVYLFVVEIILPFLIFFGGDLRIFAALGITGLMIGIQLSGNFGFFNLVVIVLCVTLLDSHASILDQSFSGIFASWQNIVTHIVMLVLYIGGLVCLPFNSWCAQAWPYWPSLVKIKARWLTEIVAFYRALSPFRVVHAYGVFPPTSSPPVRWTVVIEGSSDGQDWKPYPYRFMPSSPSSPPKFIAPYHPRLDHNIFYEAFGTNLANFLESLFGVGNPYNLAHTSGLEAIAQQLLAGNQVVASLFASNPFPDAPPSMIRVSCYALEPLTADEHRQTGNWWSMEYVGPHLLPMSLKSEAVDDMYPDPELFHWDQIIWKERSPRLKAMMQRVRAGSDTSTILLENANDLTRPDLERFWNDFIPCIGAADPGDWSALPQLVTMLQERYTAQELRRYEMIFARLSLILWAKLEPHYMGEIAPAVQAESFYHLGLQIGYVIARGRITFEEVLASPERFLAIQPEVTTAKGLFYVAIFWQEVIAFHARKFRLLESFNTLGYAPGIPQFAEAIPFLRGQYMLPDEALPIFVRRISDGEWLTIREPN